MKLSTARVDLMAILEATVPPEYALVDSVPDSVAPPVLFIAWADPMITKSTMCAWVATLEILAVAQRVEPGGQLTTLEEMISTVVPALKGTEFTVVDVTSPYPLQIGGVDYLAASINITHDMEG